METTEFTTVEVFDLIERNGIQVAPNQSIVGAFLNFFSDIKRWQEQAATLTITSVEQKNEMKIARQARLALKNIRVEVEHTRKKLKEDSLRIGQTIDAIARILTNEIAPIEAHLEEQEKFAELQEKRRKAQLRAERELALEPFAVETKHYNLEEMSEESFSSLLASITLAFEQKQATLAAAEEQRVAQAKAEAEEREAMRKENERLKAEAVIAEKARAEAEQEAQKERLAREKVEKEKAEKEAAERAAQKEAEKARLKAEKAERNRPDKAKLLAFALEIKMLSEKSVEIQSAEMTSMLESARRSLQVVSKNLSKQADEL